MALCATTREARRASRGAAPGSAGESITDREVKCARAACANTLRSVQSAGRRRGSRACADGGRRSCYKKSPADRSPLQRPHVQRPSHSACSPLSAPWSDVTQPRCTSHEYSGPLGSPLEPSSRPCASNAGPQTAFAPRGDSPSIQGPQGFQHLNRLPIGPLPPSIASHVRSPQWNLFSLWRGS